MSNFRISDGRIAYQRIADTSTTQNLPLGTIVRATDATLGEGEFIYLKGVASTVVGSPVIYNTASASNAAVGILTAGKVAATGSGKEVQGALTVAKATTPTTVTLIINRPHMQGRIT
jgi:hypothetical protein